MLTESFISQSEDQTQAFAQEIAPQLKNNDVICLQGDLGAGKTSFCRELIRALTKNNMEVPSPTFTLVQTYESDPPIWHYDLYRIEDSEEIYEIGWEEAIANGIVLVEWPERLGDNFPDQYYELKIKILDKTTREFSLKQVTGCKQNG